MSQSAAPPSQHFVAYDAEDPLGQVSHLSVSKAMIAGAAAGVLEHVVMYPADTIKTRMQAHASHSQPVYSTPFHGFRDIVRLEGVRNLYRGMTAVVAGAIPSHAVYFAVYEYCRARLGAQELQHHPLANAFSGAVATMAHDAVVTPLDVVKQRLQLARSHQLYTGVVSTVVHVARNEGVRQFYASYPTTILMNAPFMAVHFATYESLKVLLSRDGHHGALQHIVAGAGAGALGGLISNPLDIVKTRLQLQGLGEAPRYSSARDAAKHIWRTEGPGAFWKGTGARVIFFMPSAAITWTTYEAAKAILTSPQEAEAAAAARR